MDTFELRNRIKAVANRFGYKISRYYKDDTGVDFLSVMMGMSIAKRAPLRIVQVGANIGQDHILHFASHFASELLLIEPNPDLIDRLHASYDGIESKTIVNVAIGPLRTRTDLYVPGPAVTAIYEQRGMWPGGIASFNRSLLEKDITKFLGRKYASDIVAKTVNVVPLSELVADHGFGTADVLQVDTEGFDYEVLKSANIETWLPTAINFEVIHLSEADRRASFAWLENLGYHLKLSEIDCMALRPLDGACRTV